MKAFYVNPTTYNSKPLAPGFGEQDKPDTAKAAKAGKDDKADDSSNIQLSGEPGQANVSFERDIKVAKAVAAEQQRYEKEWDAQHKASTASVQKQTMDKKLKNYGEREGVQYNNWHMRPGQMVQLASAPRSQADISFQRDIVKARAVAAEQQRYEKEWEA